MEEFSTFSFTNRGIEDETPIGFKTGLREKKTFYVKNSRIVRLFFYKWRRASRNSNPYSEKSYPNVRIPGSDLLRRSLFHVYASDSYNLTVHVTDFVSGVWTTILSVSQLDDMRDTVGIGGSWSEFVDYTVASLNSDNVKLLLGENSVSNGVETARLVSQKAKGMPRIIVPLTKMLDSSASEAMANLSLELFRAFKSKKHLQGEVSSSAAATDEKDKRDATHNQLERYSSGKLDDMAPSKDNQRDSPAKQNARNTAKPAKRVPAHRRTRKRGALLQDSEEEDS